jgi:hypothetical protein
MSSYKGGHVTMSYVQIGVPHNPDVAKSLATALEQKFGASASVRTEMSKAGEGEVPVPKRSVVEIKGVPASFFDNRGRLLTQAVNACTTGLDPFLPTIVIVVEKK